MTGELRCDHNRKDDTKMKISLVAVAKFRNLRNGRWYLLTQTGQCIDERTLKSESHDTLHFDATVGRWFLNVVIVDNKGNRRSHADSEIVSLPLEAVVSSAVHFGMQHFELLRTDDTDDINDPELEAAFR